MYLRVKRIQFGIPFGDPVKNRYPRRYCCCNSQASCLTSYRKAIALNRAFLEESGLTASLSS